MDNNQYNRISSQVKDFFNECAADWDTRGKACPEKQQAIVTLAGLQPGAKVADIACGTGVMLPALLACNPSDILGIDLSEQMIAAARQKFNGTCAHFVVADLFDVTEQEFDLALIYNAYPHFPDKARLVRHVYGMLKPGGRLMIAHGASREQVNGVHGGKTVSTISWPLLAAEEEAKELRDYFTVDIIADTSQIYIISGIKLQ